MGEVHLHPLIVRALVSPHLSLDYPFQLNEPLTRNAEGNANGNSKSPSARTLLRACWALLEGSFYLTFPLTVIFLAWKSFLNDVPLVVVGIMLVAGFRDEMTKRAMGWTSSVLPGLYFNDSEENRKIVEKWDKSKRTYKAPPTCWSGDASTILPFLMNKSVMIESVRTWLRVPQDEKEGCEIRDEVIALDWFMPADCDVRAIVLILHGLNGGSEEPYVKDFIKRATELGYCSVVMIARGMQQTPVRTDRIFNGARVSDAFLTSQLLADLKLPLHAIGYSMGAIILSNMLVQKGALISAIRSAVSISGGVNICLGAEDKYTGRCRRLWQPFLVCGILKSTSRFAHKVEKLLGIRHLGYPTDMREFDQEVVAPYNGFGSGPKGLLAYYQALSPASGQAPCEKLFSIKPKMLYIHACDDPLLPIDQYEEALKTPAGNVMYLFPSNGGHVGFPTGSAFDFWKNGWQWQSEASLSFFHAVDEILT
eukprot:GEMP01012556.1.p1 GENE.GEMP01012556.1~~GEMP01012556.1.p1  ORF type:complete len:493 (+),score=40.49 GEMP01012556.1:42-1481(+)